MKFKSSEKENIHVGILNKGEPIWHGRINTTWTGQGPEVHDMITRENKQVRLVLRKFWQQPLMTRQNA